MLIIYIYIFKHISKTPAADMEAMMEDDYIENQAHVSPTKRQAPNTNDCVIYRYGSFSTDIEIIGEIPPLNSIPFLCFILKSNARLCSQRALRVCRSSRWL